MHTMLAVLIGLAVATGAGAQAPEPSGSDVTPAQAPDHTPAQAPDQAPAQAPAAAPAPSPAPVQQDACLEAVGGLSASHTYTTYMYVGVTADMLAKKGYEGEQVVTMMNEVSSLCQNAHRLVTKLQDGKLNEGDRKYLDDIQEIYQLLKSEAEALAAFAKSGRAEDSSAYESARKSVLPRIQKLLGSDGGVSPASPTPAPKASHEN